MNNKQETTFELDNSEPMTERQRRQIEAVAAMAECRVKHNGLCGCGHQAMRAFEAWDKAQVTVER